MTKKSKSRLARDQRKIPKKKEVAFTRVDHEKKLQIIFKSNMLTNQLQRDGPKIARSFDKILSKQLSEASRLVGLTTGLLSKHLFAPDDLGSRATTARLIASAINSYIASIEVARHGFPLQHGAISRSIVEVLASVIVIVTDGTALEKFHAGKLPSTKCIGQAKKSLPLIGPLWGFLSNEFVHVGSLHATLELPAPYTTADERLEFLSNSILLNSWLIYVVTELVFHDEVWCVYWKSDEQGVTFSPTDEGNEWLDRFTGELDQ